MVNKLVAAAETDTAAENDGAWFEFTASGSTFRIKLARAGLGRGAFQRDMQKRTAPYRTGVRDNSTVIPDSVLRKINADLYATHILKDWNEDDVGTPFSVDAARSALEQSSEFLEWCINTAASAENFRKITIENNAGN